VLIDIHGGPGAGGVPVWNPFTQFPVREMGFVAITPQTCAAWLRQGIPDLDNGEDREDAVRTRRCWCG
jgi:hypothetical protein